MILNNTSVTSASPAVLAALAYALGMSDEQVRHATKKKKLVATVGTKLANSATLGAAFADGTLDSAQLLNSALDAAIAAQLDAQYAADWDAAHAEDAKRAQPQDAPKGKQIKSAKAWLRELLSVDGAEYTLKQLIALTGKTEVNIRTMLSDLRSVKYCGSAGVFATKSVRKNGEVYYSKA